MSCFLSGFFRAYSIHLNLLESTSDVNISNDIWKLYSYISLPFCAIIGFHIIPVNYNSIVLNYSYIILCLLRILREERGAAQVHVYRVCCINLFISYCFSSLLSVDSSYHLVSVFTHLLCALIVKYITCLYVVT